ncbi:polyhydroxybutyrate depolymerase [Bradyrhizobium sp. 139]|nr:PHB depolymerase family esterase [Bradyrhizobium sp. 139]MCK1741304.1 polyhydroxybutyrate depolymerase [Bradyrhizobium sp. 139]
MLLLASLPWRASFGCGPTSDCLIPEGSYRIRLPSNPPAGRPLGAVVYFHGWQQSAEDVMADASLAATTERLRIVLVALNGEEKTWSFPSSPTHHRDDFAYANAVVDDIVRRFPIDRQRLLGVGFSQGASMIWYLACRDPRMFAAFAPMSGAFWQPAPDRCAAPLPVLFHLHGLADTTVPLGGREVAPGIRQDSVCDSFAILGGPRILHASEPVRLKGSEDLHLTCERSARQADGGLLELCLHAGGHFAVAGWVEHAWRAIAH